MFIRCKKKMSIFIDNNLFIPKSNVICVFPLAAEVRGLIILIQNPIKKMDMICLQL